jgi:DNA-damage-inducible protein J
MALADTYVRVRIDSRTKELVSQALADMGLSVSDVIRLLMIRMAEEHHLPFPI